VDLSAGEIRLSRRTGDRQQAAGDWQLKSEARFNTNADHETRIGNSRFDFGRYLSTTK